MNHHKEYQGRERERAEVVGLNGMVEGGWETKDLREPTSTWLMCHSDNTERFVSSLLLHATRISRVTCMAYCNYNTVDGVTAE